MWWYNEKKLIGIIISLVILLPSIGLPAELQSKPTIVLRNGETVINGQSNKLKVQVKFKTHEINIVKTGKNKTDFIRSACTYISPCSIVDKLEIIVNGKRIFVPNAMLCNLGQINEVELKLEETKGDPAPKK